MKEQAVMTESFQSVANRTMMPLSSGAKLVLRSQCHVQKQDEEMRFTMLPKKLLKQPNKGRAGELLPTDRAS